MFSGEILCESGHHETPAQIRKRPLRVGQRRIFTTPLKSELRDASAQEMLFGCRGPLGYLFSPTWHETGIQNVLVSGKYGN